jgi:hypothetical protein
MQTDRVADIIVCAQDPLTLHREKGDMTVLKRGEHCGEVPGNDLFVLFGYALGGRTNSRRRGAGFALTRHSGEAFSAPVKEREEQKRGERKAKGTETTSEMKGEGEGKDLL